MIGSLMSIDVIRFTNAVRKAKQSFVQFRARKNGNERTGSKSKRQTSDSDW